MLSLLVFAGLAGTDRRSSSGSSGMESLLRGSNSDRTGWEMLFRWVSPTNASFGALWACYKLSKKNIFSLNWLLFFVVAWKRAKSSFRTISVRVCTTPATLPTKFCYKRAMKSIGDLTLFVQIVTEPDPSKVSRGISTTWMLTTPKNICNVAISINIINKHQYVII